MKNMTIKSILISLIAISLSITAQALTVESTLSISEITYFDTLEASNTEVNIPKNIKILHSENEELNSNTILWDIVDSDDIIFYEIYRRDIQSIDGDFILIDMTKEPQYIDWDVENVEYEYKIITVDTLTTLHL